MIVSETSHRSRSRWLQACVLLGAMLVLPVGVTYAVDLEAVERRLGEWVAEGELSLEQAVAMMEALREVAGDEHEGDISRRFGEWIGEVGGKLKAAVEAGKLSEEDAWKKWHHFTEHELGPKLKATVEAGEMSEGTARRIRHDVEMAEAGEKLKAAVAKGEMTEKEARAKWTAITKTRDDDRDEGLVGHYKRMGVSLEALGGIKKALAEAAVKDEQMEGTLGGMIRVVHEMKTEGEEYEMDPGLGKYFRDDLGLGAEQIERVEGLARRVLHGMKESDRR